VPHFWVLLVSVCLLSSSLWTSSAAENPDAITPADMLPRSKIHDPHSSSEPTSVPAFLGDTLRQSPSPELAGDPTMPSSQEEEEEEEDLRSAHLPEDRHEQRHLQELRDMHRQPDAARKPSDPSGRLLHTQPQTSSQKKPSTAQQQAKEAREEKTLLRSSVAVSSATGSLLSADLVKELQTLRAQWQQERKLSARRPANACGLLCNNGSLGSFRMPIESLAAEAMRRPVFAFTGLYGRTNNRIGLLCGAYDVARRCDGLVVVPQHMLGGAIALEEWFDLESAFSPRHLALVSTGIDRLNSLFPWETVSQELLEELFPRTVADKRQPPTNSSSQPFRAAFYRFASGKLFHASDRVRLQTLRSLKFSCQVRRLAGKLFPLMDRCGVPFLPYVGLHLRWLEGSCISRIEDKSKLDHTLALSICHLTPTVLEQVRVHLGLEFAPVYLASDAEVISDQHRLENLGVIDFDKLPPLLDPTERKLAHRLKLLLDMYIITESTVFIGNPASSLSHNVCALRHGRPGCFLWK